MLEHGEIRVNGSKIVRAVMTDINEAVRKDPELAREQGRAGFRAVSRRPVGKRPLGQTLRAEPKPATVIEEDAKHVAPTVPENEERPAHRLLTQYHPSHRCHLSHRNQAKCL